MVSFHALIHALQLPFRIINFARAAYMYLSLPDDVVGEDYYFWILVELVVSAHFQWSSTPSRSI